MTLGWSLLLALLLAAAPRQTMRDTSSKAAVPIFRRRPKTCAQMSKADLVDWPSSVFARHGYLFTP